MKYSDDLSVYAKGIIMCINLRLIQNKIKLNKSKFENLSFKQPIQQKVFKCETIFHVIL